MLKNVERLSNWNKEAGIPTKDFTKDKITVLDAIKKYPGYKNNLEKYFTRLQDIKIGTMTKEVTKEETILDWMAQYVKDKLDQKVSAEFMSYEEVEDIYRKISLSSPRGFRNMFPRIIRDCIPREDEGKEYLYKEMIKEKLFKVSEIDNVIFMSANIDEVLKIEKEKFLKYVTNKTKSEKLLNLDDPLLIAWYCQHADVYVLELLFNILIYGFYPSVLQIVTYDSIFNTGLGVYISSSYKWDTNNKLSDELMFTIEVIETLIARDDFILHKDNENIYNSSLGFGMDILADDLSRLKPHYLQMYEICDNECGEFGIFRFRKSGAISYIGHNYRKTIVTTLAMLVLNKIYPNREDDIIDALKNLNNKVISYIDDLKDYANRLTWNDEENYDINSDLYVLTNIYIPATIFSAEIDEIVTIDTFKKFINN